MLNAFLKTHYGETSSQNYNNNLSHIKKAFSYLAEQSFIPDNFMRNKKRLKVMKSERVKKRQRLTLETTHSVNEVCRIKYNIREPKDNRCGIV